MIQEKKEHTREFPVVAIHCLVYNHGPYLHDCFEGFIMQQTNFPFVIVVHDDASTDNSAAIIREYTSKYPHLFRPIYETENQYSNPKVSVDCIVNAEIQKTGAKYIALCEGDDYWTDPLKLQRQVDFLEANPEYSFCCHRFKILKHTENQFINEYAHNAYTANQNLIIDENIFAKYWTTQWLTTVTRADLFFEACDTAKQLFGRCLDVYLYFLLLQKGNGVSLNQQMGIYRWHSNGASIGRTHYKRVLDGYNVYSLLLQHFPNKTSILTKTKNYATSLLGYKNCFKKSDRILYKQIRPLYSSTKEYLKATAIFIIIPPCIWNILRNTYSFIKFHD